MASEQGLDDGFLEMFSDLMPVEADETDGMVCKIQYEPEFDRLMGIFRALLAKNGDQGGEISERALLCTEQVIDNNAANYTAWYYRRQCLFGLNSDLNLELMYVSDCALNNPKNYQIWYHRRVIVERLNDGSKEKGFTASVLDKDAKNYHAWSHRQWALQHFNMFEGELEYVNKMLENDLRNNSAWNQRWFVLSNTVKDPTTGKIPRSVLELEINYALDIAEKAPNNESPFNYIIGLMRGETYEEFPFILQRIERFRAEEEEEESKKNAPPLLGLLIEIYSQQRQNDRVGDLCDVLSSGYDRIRAKYWQKVKEEAMKTSSE